jgi:hypothetical protein
MRRLRQLEEENRRLKAIVADQALDLRALKDVLAKTVGARAVHRAGQADLERAYRKLQCALARGMPE